MASYQIVDAYYSVFQQWVKLTGTKPEQMRLRLNTLDVM